MKLTSLSHLALTLRSSEATFPFPNTLQWVLKANVLLLVLSWCEELGWIHLAQDKDQLRALVDPEINVWLWII